MAPTDRHVSVPKPFSSGDVNDWFQCFDISSKANGWNNATKALKLPTLLEGEALAVWLDLSEEEQDDYASAKEAMMRTMIPMELARGILICFCTCAKETTRTGHAKPGQAGP